MREVARPSGRRRCAAAPSQPRYGDASGRLPVGGPSVTAAKDRSFSPVIGAVYGSVQRYRQPKLLMRLTFVWQPLCVFTYRPLQRPFLC
jgi:hypothetical protein